MVTLVVTLPVQPGKENKLIEITSKLVEKVKNEPGNRSYELFRSVSNPSTFLMFEEYVDEAAMEAHSSSSYLKEALGELGSVLAGPPVMRKY